MKHETRSKQLKKVVLEFKKTNSLNSLIVRMRNDGLTITYPTIKRWLDNESDMQIGTFDQIEAYIIDTKKGVK